MSTKFEVAKYNGKWAVFAKASRTFSDIGRGRKLCQQRVLELNNIVED